MDLLTMLSEQLAEKPALIEDRQGEEVSIWSYAELEANANRLAHVFRDLGVAPRERIVWCGKNSMMVVACGHAARKVGAISVPLNYRLTAAEAAFVVDDCDACVAFIDAEFVPLFEAIRGETAQLRHVLVFGGRPGSDMQSLEERMRAAPDAPPGILGEFDGGAMIYTSGTTGKPKGAVRQSGGDPEQLMAMLNHIGYVPDDVYITTGPLYHSGPGGFLGMATTLGNTAILQRDFDERDWLRLVEKYRVTTTFSAPTPIRRICQLPEEVLSRYDRSSLRVMIANAAPWSYALKLAYLETFPEDSLFEVYGSTELGVNTILRPEHQRSKPGSCGRCAPGVEIRLYAEDGTIVEEPHVPGELFVRSASVFQTYHKARDKYLEDQRDGWQTVGDIAYFDEEGFFFICDRKKDMIISGGMNIYPAEIEAALERHERVLEVAVFGIPSDEWGESVHACVVKRPESELDAQSLVAFAREKLAGYKVPRSIEFVREIPKTGTGKILKRILREPYWQDQISQSAA